MAAEVVWLNKAKHDLREILDHIAIENPRAAERYVAELQAACARLALFPLSGKRYNDRYRVLIFRNHLVFHHYDNAERTVSIGAVIDGRRDVARLIGD